MVKYQEHPNCLTNHASFCQANVECDTCYEPLLIQPLTLRNEIRINFLKILVNIDLPFSQSNKHTGQVRNTFGRYFEFIPFGGFSHDCQ